MAPRAERPDMAAYGVPEDDDGLLPWSWAEERLLATRNYWVSTANVDGRPHSMPVWGVWLPDRERFWFSCATTARKARNIRENSRIVVAPTDSVEVVSLEGQALEVTGGNLDEAASAFWRKYGEEMDSTEAEVTEFVSENASFEIQPERAFGLIERPEDFGRRATRWVWDKYSLGLGQVTVGQN